MLSWPLRTLRKARRTVYALTGRRAIVIEPGLLSGMTDRSYPPGALALMRCDEREDGAGDLVFENRKTWVGMPQAVGFLAVERVREVEAMVRKALLAAGPSTQQTATISAGGRAYRISGTFRLYQAVGLAVSGLTAFCLVGNLVVALAALILMRGKAPHRSRFTRRRERVARPPGGRRLRCHRRRLAGRRRADRLAFVQVGPGDPHRDRRHRGGGRRASQLAPHGRFAGR